MLALLTSEKSFGNRWVGHRCWNERRDLHRRRMALAEQMAALRRGSALLFGDRPALCDDLVRDGFLTVPNFLAPDLFKRVSAEAEAAIDTAAEAQPIGQNDKAGFGAKQPFPGGFDRWDGSTLNRYLTIAKPAVPAIAGAAALPSLNALTRQIVGVPHATAKTQLYLTVNGDDQANYDVQRDLHRDTFFSAMKFWLFLRPVRAADGPFTFVPGSHRLTPERLAWEQAEACRIVESSGRDLNTGGSFRIDEAGLAALGLPTPVACVCEANTLVIANTLGFHARGRAEPGTERLALYGWRRQFPFGLIGR